MTRPVDILLVEDSPGDVRLTQEALKEGKLANRLHVVSDGEEALAFLHRRGTFASAVRPDLISIVTPFNLILRHNTVRSPLVKAFAQALGVDLKAPV